MLELTDFIKNNGTGAAVIVIIAYFTFKTLSTVFEAKYKSWVNKREEKKNDPHGLLNHMFFTKANYLLQARIPHLQIKDPIKAAMFKDFLSIQIGAMTKTFKDFIQAGDINKIPQEDFSAKVIDLFVSCINLYESKAVLHGIPQEVVSRISNLHSVTSAETLAKFHTYTTSEWRNSNSEVMGRILTVLEVNIIDSVENVGQTLIQLDGDSDGTI